MTDQTIAPARPVQGAGHGGHPTSVHPTWCLGDVVGCDFHRGEATVIPATGGRHHNACDGVVHPAFEVGAATTGDNQPGVFLSVLTPGAYEPIMRPAEVRTLIGDLAQALAVAEGSAL